MEKYYKVRDVNKIVEKLAKEPSYQHNGEDFYSGVCAVEGEFMCLDAIEFEEPKIGKWIPVSTKPGVYTDMKCSLCGARIKYSEFFNGNYNYCYKCGARMSGEENVN